jgi:hypothetical protein
MNAPPFTITQDSVTVILDSKAYTVQKGAPNFLALRQAIVSERWDDIPKNLTVGKSISEWAKGKFTVDGNVISYEGNKLPEELNERILAMATNGENPTALFKFWERLSKNPSYRSVNQLWPFLKHIGIPITDDGYFLAYKSVRSNYKDVHSGTIDNRPGVVVDMPRNKISDDPQTPCHEGLHVGALSYAQSFGGERIVVCKVDPEHVVCVPHDEQSRKMRVCKYEVLGNYGSQLPSTTITAEEVLEEDEEEDTTSDEGADREPTAETEDEPASGSAPVILAQGKKEEDDTKDKPARKKSKYDSMGMKELLDVSIEDLRKYAGGVLKIVGASKIPGGKLALVTRIQEVRK